MSIKLAFVYIIECFCTGSHAKGIGDIEINVIIHVALLGTPPNFFYTFALCIVEQAFSASALFIHFFSSSVENLKDGIKS